MNMPLSSIFATNRRALSGVLEFLTLPLSLIRLVRAALGRRRWQQAPPFAGMNNHLRRDIGLPPFDDARRWY